MDAPEKVEAELAAHRRVILELLAQLARDTWTKDFADEQERHYRVLLRILARHRSTSE